MGISAWHAETTWGGMCWAGEAGEAGGWVWGAILTGHTSNKASPTRYNEGRFDCGRGLKVVNMSD